MSTLIRGLRCCNTEQDQRQLQRSIDRMARLARQAQHPAAPSYQPPPRPEFPAGIVPVFVINQPLRTRR